VRRFAAVALALVVAPAAVGAPSPEPYAASLAYAKCMRAQGVPHPNPDAKGDFSLTPAQEARMRAVPRAKRKAADDACFHTLKGLNLKPLSAGALARATEVVADLGRCIERHGFQVGKAQAKNLTRGRAFFGFERTAQPATAADRKRLASVEHDCERQVDMAARITKIVEADRATGRPAL
jgi:hypothetical protein